MTVFMDASLIAFWTSLTPQVALAGMPLVIYYLVLTAAMWVIIAVVAAAKGRRLGQHPLQRQLA